MMQSWRQRRLQPSGPVRSVGVALMYPSEFSPSLVATGSFQHRRSSSERDQFTAIKNVHKGGKYIRNSRLRQFLFGDVLFKIGNRLVKLDNIDEFLPDRSTISSFWKFLLINTCFSLCRTADRSMAGSTGRAFFIHIEKIQSNRFFKTAFPSLSINKWRLYLCQSENSKLSREKIRTRRK